MSILNWLSSLFRKPVVAPIPVPPPVPLPIWKPTTEYQFTSQQIADISAGAKEHIYTWDSDYLVVSMEDWKKIFADVLSNMPVYQNQVWDCDNFAFLAMARVAERYKVNSCGVAIGQAPLGEHAFNVFASWENDKLTLHTLEPQTGKIDPVGYVYDIVIFS